MLEQSSCKNKMRQENLSISEKTKKIETPRTSQKRILAPGPYMRKINADESRPREQIENAGVPVEDAKKSRYMLKSLPNWCSMSTILHFDCRTRQNLFEWTILPHIPSESKSLGLLITVDFILPQIIVVIFALGAIIHGRTRCRMRSGSTWERLTRDSDFAIVVLLRSKSSEPGGMDQKGFLAVRRWRYDKRLYLELQSGLVRPIHVFEPRSLANA